jgi:hypothetical protein
MAVSAAAIWGDMEANFFDVVTADRADDTLRPFRCPILLMPEETGNLVATFKNPVDKPLEFSVVTHVSDGYVTLMREVNSTVEVAPGEKESLRLPVTADDMVYDYLILSRIFVRRRYPLPARQASCGVLVLDLPFRKGSHVLSVAITISLALMVGGIVLWGVANRPLSALDRNAARAMGALAAFVLVALVVSLLGYWFVATFIWAGIVLLIGGIFGHFGAQFRTIGS